MKLNTEQIKPILIEEFENIRIQTELKELYNLTNEISSGQLIVIAGRPGTGKTEKVLSIFSNHTNLYSLNVCFYTLELSKKQLIKRLIKNNDNAVYCFQNSTGFICDNSDIGIRDIAEDLTQHNFQSAYKIIIIDYIQLMSDIGAIDFWESLKNLAIENNYIIIALSQLESSFLYDKDKNNVSEFLLIAKHGNESIDHFLVLDYKD